MCGRGSTGNRVPDEPDVCAYDGACRKKKDGVIVEWKMSSLKEAAKGPSTMTSVTGGASDRIRRALV